MDYIRTKVSHTNLPELADLPEDASVLIYKDNLGNSKFVPAGLCFQIYDTEHPAIRKIHRYSILRPDRRPPDYFTDTASLFKTLQFWEP